MEQQNDTLHHIISRISEEEKKQFRNSLLCGGKKSQSIELFDLICSMKEFDSKKYKDYISRKKLEKSIASIKSQLKEKLLNWLTVQLKAPSGTNWYFELSKGDLFMKLEMYSEAKSLFEHIKDESYQKMTGYIELLTLSPLSLLAQFEQPDNIMVKTVELSDRLVTLSGKIQAMTTGYNYYLRTNLVFYESRSLNKSSHHQMVQQLRRESLFSLNEAFAPFEVLLYILQVRSLIYQMMGDWNAAYTENSKLYNAIIKYEDKFQAHQVHEYCLILRDRLYYCLLSGNINEFKELYPLLYKKSQTAQNNNTEYVLRLKVIHLLFLMQTENKEQLKKDLKRYELFYGTSTWKADLVANKKEALLYAGFAYMYITNWEGAIQQFDRLLKMNVKAVGVDFDHASQLMLLLCHLADYLSTSNTRLTEPSPFLHNQCDAYYNYIIRNKLEAPVEKIIVKGLKEFAKGGSKSEQQKKLTSTIQRMKKELSTPVPYYQMQLAEFDWASWLEEIIQTFCSR